MPFKEIQNPGGVPWAWRSSGRSSSSSSSRTVLPFSNIGYCCLIYHTGNTWTSHTCVIQEYQSYTTSPCLDHDSMSLPWVQHGLPMALPWVHIYPIGPCLCHESMSKPWVHVHTMSSSLYHHCSYHEYRNFNYRKNKTKTKKLQNFFLQKCNFQKCRNTNNTNTEILITKIHKYKLQTYK